MKISILFYALGFALAGNPWGIDAAIFTVTNSANSGSGTLRAAIGASNLLAGKDTIRFNLSKQPITVSSQLPTITRSVFIDGTTQPGYTKFPLVVITPVSGGSFTGLVIHADNCDIQAIQIASFDSGLYIDGDENTISGCYAVSNEVNGISVQGLENDVTTCYSGGNRVGIDVQHAAAGPSGSNRVYNCSVGMHPLTGVVSPNLRGIYVTSDHNRIGGTGSYEGNYVSGNSSTGIQIGWISSGNSIRGNRIGTNRSGTSAVPNGYGVYISGASNTVGGIKSGSMNLISGNISAGIYIKSGLSAELTGTRIEGNYIGLNRTGDAAVPNAIGIYIEGTRNGSNIIGGTTSWSANVISGNTENGIELRNTYSNRILGNLIGTAATGSSSIGNGENGIYLSNASGTEIGGSTAGSGNTIAGNGERGIRTWSWCRNSRIDGNHIGVSVSGSTALGNAGGGIYIFNSPDIEIGTTRGNVISGNGDHGIYLLGETNCHHCSISGNIIGLNAAGTTILANQGDGILMEECHENTVGSGNTLGGNNVGIHLDGCRDCTLIGNRIGVDQSGDQPAPNRSHGILLHRSNGTLIGGSIVSGGNKISANAAAGIYCFVSNDTTIKGNVIGGHLVDGVNFGGNDEDGIMLRASATNHVGGIDLFHANFISHNGRNGVTMNGDGTGNSMEMNLIWANGGMGIDLNDDGVTLNDTIIKGDPDTGDNNLQNYPRITSVSIAPGTVRIQGRLDSGLSKNYDLYFYGNTGMEPSGYGEGEVYLGMINQSTHGLGSLQFDTTFPSPSPMPGYITATARQTTTGDSSEFSHLFMVDSDGDGMPDAWELEHFGHITDGDPTGDPDLDGLSNLGEFIADTQPHDQSSLLSIMAVHHLTVETNQVTLAFVASSTNRQYLLQHCMDPTAHPMVWEHGFRGYEPGNDDLLRLIDLTPTGGVSAVYRAKARLP